MQLIQELKQWPIQPMQKLKQWLKQPIQKLKQWLKQLIQKLQQKFGQKPKQELEHELELHEYVYRRIESGEPLRDPTRMVG